MFRFARPALCVLLLTALVAAVNPLTHAQFGSLSLSLTSEEDIGFDCPISSALDPSGSTLWVLMDNCFGEDFSLRTFGVGGGQAINDEEHDFSDALTGLEGMFAALGSTSLTIAPDGSLTINYSDADFQPASLRIPAGSDGTSSVPGDGNASLLTTYTEYPEATVYSADGSQAIAIGETSLHVLDMQTGTEILAFDLPGGDYNAYPAFSADGKQVYITQLNNYDDPTATASTMSVYNLPDGELVASYDLPSPLAYVSPNGQFAAIIMPSNDLTDDELVVIDLVNNNYSDTLDIFEPSRHATTCLNTGDDISDVDFTVSGQLFLMDLEWLPDSSGFLTVNSYLGEGAEGDGGWVCLFNYSRLRHYTVAYE